MNNTRKSFVEIYVFACKSSNLPLLKNVVYHVMTYCSGDISTESALFGYFNP